MKNVVRTHEPALARPAEFVRSVWSDLRRCRTLAVELAKRDMRSQYRQWLWGISVVVLPPLALTALALGFRRTGILHVDSAAIPYALFVLLGVILWTTIIDAMNAPIYGFAADLRLLARTCAPPEAVVFGKLGTVFMNLLVKTILLAVAVAYYRAPVPAAAVFAPIGFASLILIGTAIGLLIAPINLLYRHVSWVLGTVTTLWFFFSPVYFPAPSGGTVGAIMRLNPVTCVLSDTRSLILTGTIMSPVRDLLVTLGAGVLLVVCWLYARVVLSVAVEQVNQ